MFMDIIQPRFYEKMIGSMSFGFSKLVTTRERIEDDMKNDKIPGTTRASSVVKKFSDNFPK